jgi:hypothetical protein
LKKIKQWPTMPCFQAASSAMELGGWMDAVGVGGEWGWLRLKADLRKEGEMGRFCEKEANDTAFSRDVVGIGVGWVRGQSLGQGRGEWLRLEVVLRGGGEGGSKVENQANNTHRVFTQCRWQWGGVGARMKP